MPRPDFSNYVVHFTKKGRPLGLSVPKKKTVAGLKDIAKMSAYERLLALLEGGAIRATNMPHTHMPCVCFTECVWGSLLDHAKRYSCYGVGFHKELLFKVGGGPVFYMRQDLFAEQKEHGAFADAVWPFVTPFAPEYAPAAHLAKYNKGKALDYSHEREWRVPSDFAFSPSNVSFIIVDTYGDEAHMPRGIKDAVGREKIILMENYRKVNELWPWHHY